MAHPNFFPGGSGTCTSAAALFRRVPAKLAATRPWPTLVMNPRRVISFTNESDIGGLLVRCERLLTDHDRRILPHRCAAGHRTKCVDTGVLDLVRVMLL